ncbi:MAG: PrsW family intramembrane metalloprotease [Anaerolinea sp.]|nr:PrsW family intramembrane metalloprotease [Anaerolinea sp.]
MTQNRWLLWVVFILSAAGAGLGVLAALMMAIVWLVSLTGGDATLYASLSLGLFTGAVLMMPAGVLAYRRLNGYPEWQLPLPVRPLFNLGAFLGWVLCLFLGALAGQTFLGGLFVFGAAVFPPLYAYGVASGRAQPGGLRPWSAVLTTMIGVMPLSFLLEAVVIVTIVIALGVRSANDAQFMALLQELARQADLVQTNPDLAESFVATVFEQPGVLAGVLIFLSVITPLIEELIKPLAVWLLAGRVSPREGFLFGMIGGAFFAATENLNALAVAASGSDWVGTAFGRAGTSLLHVATAGLVGFGIATAFRKRRPLALLGAYLTAVVLHGFWNLFGVAQGLAPLTNDLSFQRLGHFAPLAMGLLAGLILLVLFVTAYWARPDRQDLGLTTAATVQAVALEQPVNFPPDQGEEPSDGLDK